MRHALKAALLLSSAFVATPVLAQSQPIPPENYTLDARGVDLVSGIFVHPSSDVVIGQPDAGGMAFGKTYLMGGSSSGGRDGLLGTINASGSTYTVSIGASSSLFTKSGSTFTPMSNTGDTLVQSGSNYTFTTSDGLIASFVTLSAPVGSPYRATALLASVKKPGGDLTSYTYDTQFYCTDEWPWEQCRHTAPTTRLVEVRTNRGFRLNYIYESDDPDPDVSRWFNLVTVRGENLAATPSAGYIWPSATYEYVPPTSTSSAMTKVTDQSGRETRYIYDGARINHIRYPGSTSDDVTIAYDASGKVSSVADASGSWTYAYADSGTTRTTAVTGPLGQSLTVVSDQTIGRATSVKNALNQTISYQYDSQRRLQRITQPEGDYAQLTYDTRGNVTQTLYVPKSGSGLANLTTSASFPSSCTNPVTCNLPTSTTDARGGVTDYTYDSTHGGVLTVTAPAPATGATRPQTRVSYAAQTAYFKNNAGVIVAAPTPVTLPVSVSTCATGTASSCVGTAAESRTVVTYGTAGVANNLLPTSVSQGSGDGLLTATTQATYTADGDVASVDGPLAGTADTTTYRYDDARQPVGVIGPDPDGAGALLRRAQRATYDARGNVTLVEAGTVTGLTEANWAAFSSLQRVASTYDAYGRVTQQRTQSGSTTHSLVQTSYDAAGRADCVTTRMNPTTFASPPASACTLATAGAFGPDRATKYGYDAAGRLTSTISGYGSGAPITESATYTANGKPLTLTDGAGNVSTMVYDGFDRLSRLRYPNASGGGSSTTDYEEYGYDAGSNVISFRNRAGELIGAGYDALNRQTALGGSVVADRTFAYDLMNRPTAVTYSTSGAGSTRTWDALGRMTSETQTGVGAIGYGYDLAGRRTTMSWPDGFFANYDYNVAGDLTAIRENGAADWTLASYTYDNLGRRTAQSRANAATTTWGYDGASRLTSLSHDLAGTANDQTLGFTYNPAGQIATRSMSNTAYAYTPGTGTTAYVNNGKNQVTSVGGTAVGYDGRQNITTAPSGSYGYNANNELTSATVGGTSTALSYDPAGRLYQVGTTRFAYDGQQVIGEYNTSGGLLRRYVPGLGLDEVVTAYEGSGYDRRWLLQDERRSVVSITDGSANAIATNTYDEYGVPGAGNSGLFQYTGQMWLPQAQLYHYRARAYAPQLGRFMQADPIGYQAGANVYAYVSGDPVNWMDPYGLERKFVVICVGPATDPDTGEVTGTIIGTGAPQCSTFGVRRGFGGFGGGVGFGGRGPGGGGGSFPGAGFSGPPIQSDPTYSAYNEARTNAMNSNSWMAIPVLAPGAVVVGLELGAAGAVTGGGRAAGSLFGRVCNCFVAGTEVQTVDGLKSIEQVVVGDQVLARDDATGETAFKPVVALIAGSEREIWEVTVETTDAQGRVQREPIGTTDEHPWRTAAGAWLETKDLTPGTELVSADGDSAIVITALKTDRIEPTYNFEVEGFHTYFVGESGVWVHNACDRLLGNLLSRAGEIARTVARSRGASASNVRQMGPWADRTLLQVAEAAARGDRSAATALKIIKQAGRLGQRY